MAFWFMAGLAAGIGIFAALAGIALFMCVKVDGLDGLDPTHPKR